MNNANLWAPWRMQYLRELTRQVDELGDENGESSNFLAQYWSHPQSDQAHHVIHRNHHGMILLNRYPYANGHLLIALGEPRSTLLDYEPKQRAEFWKLLELGMDLIRRTLSPQGINLGINEGRAAGAGIPEHLHGHLVPRWGGDTNFITITGGVRVIPDALESMATAYRETLEKMNPS